MRVYTYHSISNIKRAGERALSTPFSSERVLKPIHGASVDHMEARAMSGALQTLFEVREDLMLLSVGRGFCSVQMQGL